MTRRLPWNRVSLSLALAAPVWLAACGSAEAVDPEAVELCLAREHDAPEPGVEVHLRLWPGDGDQAARQVRYEIGPRAFDDLAGVAARLEAFDPAATCVRVVTHPRVLYRDVTSLLDHLIELGFVSIDLRTAELDAAEPAAAQPGIEEPS